MSSALLLDPAEMLPRQAYFDPDWHRWEMETLFARQWHFAGMTNDVPTSGDFTCVDVGASPMVVVRQNDGSLRAFHNLCRHRGAVILEGRGNVRAGIRCFYHSWIYDLDGALRGIPQRDQFGAVATTDLGLKGGAIEVFAGMMFVHTDPGAQGTLLKWLDAFPEHFGPFEPETMTEIMDDSMPVAANWKLFIENHIDGYHLAHLHRRSIHGIDHDQQRHSLYGNHWTIHEPLTRANELPEFEQRIPGLVLFPDDAHWMASNVHLLFPNLGVATGSKWFLTLQALPTGPATSVIRTRMRVRFPTDDQVLPDLAYNTSGNSADTDLMAEDRMAAERLQKAMSSPQFRIGPLAREYECAVLAFHQSILQQRERTMA
jgi:choline monooxygenase